MAVHGDTLSTWLGAIAGHWAGGDVVHLESGLSSGKWSDPFPEELLRRLTFRKSSYALCPNDAATQRMLTYPQCTVVNTHENTLLDCVRYALEDRDAGTEARADFVVSIHRFQNIYQKDRLLQIVSEITELAELGSVWFIMHPPTELRLRKYGLFDALRATENVILLPRMAYTQFLALMSNARAVFSDGGSNQEELSYLGVPTVLYRERSERPDGLDGNIVFRGDLAGTPVEAVRSGEIEKLRRDSRINDAVQPSQSTVDALLEWADAAQPDKAHVR